MLLVVVVMMMSLHSVAVTVVAVGEGEGMLSLGNSSLRWNSEEDGAYNVIKSTFHGELGLRRPAQLPALSLSGRKMSYEGYVRCGIGYCPPQSPICCGQPPHFYCVPGGSKCCFSPGGQVTACGQSDECCVAGGNATCCEQGTTCRRNVNWSICVREACTKYQTADDCLYKTNSCGWCCEERRCIDKNQHCSMGENPVKSGETCSSPCQYAETCTLCLSYGNSGRESDSCVWCCAKQSCIPKSRALECGNNQEVGLLGLCSVCQANGAGINPQFVGTMSQFFAMLSGIVLIVGIMSCLGVIRAFIYFRGDVVAPNGMRLSDVDAQLAVRRHGFGADEPISAHGRVRSTLRRYYDMVVLMFKSKSKIENHYEEIHVSPCLGTVLSCAMCHRMQHVCILASVANTMKGVKSVKERKESDVNNSVQALDNDVVIMLPCCHAFCRPCLGLRPSKGSSVPHVCESAVSTQPREADTIAENYIHLHIATEGDKASSKEEVSSAPNARHLSREEKQNESSSLSSVPREGNDDRNNMTPSTMIMTTTTTTTTRQPQRRAQVWKDGFVRSLKKLNPWSTKPPLKEETLLEVVVLKKIKSKCPKCRQVVKDVLLPENILQL